MCRIPTYLRVVVAAVLSLSLFFPSVHASDVAARIDAQIRPIAERDHFSGCLLVAQGEEILYERCFGKANVELDVDNTSTTRFAIASITKGLQVILLARLVDEGRLALDDRLAHWIPDFPLADSLTVEDLANHTAGVPHRVTDPDAETVPRTAADMVELVKERGLIDDSIGTSMYSSAGYSVLANVLERAGGASWEELMQRYVFAPARMDATLHPSDGRIVPQRASSYRWTLEGLRNTQPKDLSFLVGAGSLYSTSGDLFRYVRAVVDGTYGETAKEYLLDEGDMSSNGRTNGYRAFLDYDAESDRTLVVCANVFTGSLDRLRKTIPAICAGEEVEPPIVPDFSTASAVDPESLRQFSGLYELRPGTILDVEPRGAALYANDWLLIPQGGDTFFSPQDYSRVVFVRDEDGAILRMDWGEGPYAIPRVGDRGEPAESSSEAQ